MYVCVVIFYLHNITVGYGSICCFNRLLHCVFTRVVLAIPNFLIFCCDSTICSENVGKMLLRALLSDKVCNNASKIPMPTSRNIYDVSGLYPLSKDIRS